MKTSKPWRWMERFFLLAGIAGVTAALAGMLAPLAWQAWANREFNRERRVAAETQGGPEIPFGTPGRIAEDGLIGRLSIPRLNLSTIVREGTSSAILSLAAGHIPGTALPGQSGNIAVAGHRDTLFRGLKDIQAGDLVEFETFHGRLEYRVQSTEVVSPKDVSVLQAGQKNELTLVTCFPFYYIGSAPDRFIVKAIEIAWDPMAPEAWAKMPEQEARAAQGEKAARRRRPATQDASFTIPIHHSRVLGPGIRLGVTDIRGGRVSGWMWLMPEQRTVWLRDQKAREPVAFYSDGRRREVTITSVTSEAATARLSP
ncbi:MAG TPA: class D sortase [Bryobacteraceae bacterium]|nr:class D sortase [Bryobacteraceae bacterium]